MKTAFLTFAVLFLVSSAWCADDPAQVQSAPAEQPVAPEQQATAQIPTKVNVASSPKTQAKTNTRENRASGDAPNETQLTKATWFLAKLTLLLVIVGLSQVALFYWQLRLIRKSLEDARVAAEAARDGAKAARDSADTARLSMIASERAYVHHDGCKYISHPDRNTGKIFWRIRPRWKNSGNTPTRNLWIFTQYELRDTELPENFPFEIERSFDPRPTLIGPEGCIEGAAFNIFGEDVLAVSKQQKHFYVWGVAHYRDVFPGTPERVTKFCYFVRGTAGDPLSAYDAKTNLVELFFTAYHRHNCADEDCIDAQAT
jgi:hypothetical protein